VVTNSRLMPDEDDDDDAILRTMRNPEPRTVRRMHLSLLRAPHCVHDGVYSRPTLGARVVLFKVLDKLAT